jgi:hypothetical protein
MFVNCNGQMKVGKSEIKTVESFKYLGVMLNNTSV